MYIAWSGSDDEALIYRDSIDRLLLELDLRSALEAFDNSGESSNLHTIHAERTSKFHMAQELRAALRLKYRIPALSPPRPPPPIYPRIFDLNNYAASGTAGRSFSYYPGRGYLCKTIRDSGQGKGDDHFRSNVLSTNQARYVHDHNLRACLV
jgi:hypothetical protein